MRFTKDYNQDITDDRVSRINSAGIINITLENLWRDCYSSMAKGDLVTWSRKLDSIWAILGGDEPQGGEVDKQVYDIDLQIYKTGSLSHKKNGFVAIGEDESQIMALQYLLLKKKSLFLRRLQNKQGKGTAYNDPEFDDFE